MRTTLLYKETRIDVLFDAAHDDLIHEGDWYIDLCGKKLYVVRHREGKKTYFHRFILDACTGQIVDHINQNTLDNRRKNLRFTTKSKNGLNNNARGYVKTPDCKNRWTAGITVNRKRIHLGQFGSKKEAHAAYLAARKQHI